MSNQTKHRFRKIYIQITNLCNLNCSFCTSSSTNKPSFLSLTQFDDILKQISGYTSHLYLHVTGEPLMHPQLIGLLDLCLQYNLSVIIVTNGLLLGTRGHEFVNHPAVKQVNVSLHCYHEIQNPQAKINYLSSVFSFLQIAQNSHPLISLRIWNISTEETFDWLQSNQPILEAIEKTFSTSIQIPVPISGRNGIYLAGRIWLNFDYKFQWPSLSKPQISAMGKCLALRDHIAILTDGTVVPCCLDSAGVINLGNIFQSSLNDILLSHRAIRLIEGFRRSQRVEPLCSRCNFIK